MDGTQRLVSLLGTGMRTLAVLQVASLIDFMFLRSLLQSDPVGSLYFKLFLGCQLIMICIIVIITSGAELAPASLQLLIFFALAALLLSIFECIRIFTAPPFGWVDALMATYFLALNVAIVAAALFARFAFDWATWDRAVQLYAEIGSLYGTAYENAKKAVQSRAVLFFFVEALVPAEFVTLFFYFVAVAALGKDNYNFTGWIYTLHFFGTLVALVWYLRTSEYKNRSETEVALRLGTSRPPSIQPIASIYTLLLVLETCQLIFAQGYDHPQLIVLRAFLCLISAVYVVVSTLLGLEYSAPPRQITIFYALQFFLGIVATVDGFWTVTYFCYASAVRIDAIFWNLAHALTLSTAIATVFVASRPLDAVATLGVVACVVACVDIIVTGRVISLDKRSDEIFVQVVFLLISVAYVVIAGVSWPGSKDSDAAGYMRLVEAEKMTADSMIESVSMSFRSTKMLKELRDVDVWVRAVARRIHFIVTGPIKIVAVIEAVFVIYYTVILVTGVEVGGAIEPEWYQWFYVVHFLSVFSAMVVLSFELNFNTSLTFMVIMAVTCLVIDSILMGFLAEIVSDGELAIQSFFFGCDVLYIVFFAMIVYRTDPRAFAILLTMPSLSDRLQSHMNK